MILAVHGLPTTFTAKAAYFAGNEAGGYTDAVEEDSLTEEELPKTKMRFVQTNFNGDNGILTMSLQIKLEPGERQETISEGIFVFQTDVNNVVPVTRPSANLQGVTEERKSFFLPEGKTAVVADDSSSGSSVIKAYLASGRAEKISDTTFSLAMSNEHFQPKYTGYMVSSVRAVGREATGLLDCYFQFSYNYNDFPGWKYNSAEYKYERVWEWSDEQNGYVSRWIWDSGKKEYVESDELNTDPETDPNITVDGQDLYINVMDFDFQCYSGYENGEAKPAHNTDCLFSGSIKVPESAEEAQAIVEQFSYEADDGTVPMAMGGAGFIPKYWDDQTALIHDGESTAYYYYEQPSLSAWRKNGGSRTEWSNGPMELIEGETAPGLWYSNKGNNYVVTGLIASITNTISSLDDPIANADFQIPQDSNHKEVENGHYPRYVIPTKDDPQDLIPVAYQLNKRSPLKYFLGTEVSENSALSPEKEDLTGFLDSLTWGFILPDSTPLESIESLSGNNRTVTVAVDTDEHGSEISLRVPTASGQEYLVKYATITDTVESGGEQTPGDWDGAKLWEVYKVR